MDNRAVGVMDSGVGGLTVARVLAEKYPKEGIVFLGDTARNPYGERPVEEIVRFSVSNQGFPSEEGREDDSGGVQYHFLQRAAILP